MLRGVKDSVPLYSEGFSIVLDKALMPKIEILYEIPESVVAPLNEGEKVGRVIYKCDGEQLGYSDIIVGESIDQISYFGILLRIVKRIVMG